MADTPTGDMRGRYAALVARLDAADGSTDRAALKADIIDLFRAVERGIAELGALKEDVKKLAERWKSIGGGPPSLTAPQPAPPVRAVTTVLRSGRPSDFMSESFFVFQARSILPDVASVTSASTKVSAGKGRSDGPRKT